GQRVEQAVVAAALAGLHDAGDLVEGLEVLHPVGLQRRRTFAGAGLRSATLRALLGLGLGLGVGLLGLGLGGGVLLGLVGLLLRLGLGVWLLGGRLRGERVVGAGAQLAVGRHVVGLLPPEDGAGRVFARHPVVAGAQVPLNRLPLLG